MNKKYDMIIEQLAQIYAENHQIGFVLGAGVTKNSGVPDWRELAFQFFEKAQKKNQNIFS